METTDPREDSAVHDTSNNMDQNTTMSENQDIFAPLLTLESQYHIEGYNLGVTDGARAGRIEGRLFGLEKGFDKFVEMGRLAGKAAVWEGRLVGLSVSERTRKNVARLVELTDPATLSTVNDEDAVGEFDERLIGAKAKAKVVASALGEGDAVPTRDEALLAGASGSGVRTREGTSKGGSEMEDFTGIRGSKAAEKTGM